MRRTLLLVVWIATDLVLFLGAYLIAYFLRVGFLFSTDFPIDRYLTAALVVAPVWIAVLTFLNVFGLTRVQAARKNIAYMLFSAVLGLSFFTLAYYFLYTAFFSRLLLIYAGVLSFALPLVWHLAFDQWQRRILRADPPSYPLLVVGSNRDAGRMIQLLRERQSPLKAVGVVDSSGTAGSEVAGIPVLGRLHKLEEILREKRISHLLQCAEIEHTFNIIEVCRKQRVTYLLLPFVLGITGSEKVMEIEGVPVVVARE